MKGNVLITGVSSGIGAGLAEYYLSEGWRVLGCCRRKPVQLTDRECFHFVACDLSQFNTVPSAMEKLFQGIANCDLAILNAGVLSRFGDMQSVSITESQQVMDVNLWANKAILDWLLGSLNSCRQVVTISSGAGINGNRGWNAYAISKAALNMLTTLYAQEAPKTHFTALAPGLVDTAMQDVLCDLPADERFPTLDSLRSRRQTPEMPRPDRFAPCLAGIISELPEHVESGNYIDIRKLNR